MRFVVILIFVLAAPLIASCDGPQPEPSVPALSGVPDSYSIASGMTLSRAAPGVLANDPNGGKGLTARLVGESRYGEVTLAADGSFTYEPDYKFSGRDFFTYQVSDGESVSEPVVVVITYPNVVVVIVDDLGLGDLDIYNDRAFAETPNIAALADSGITFTHSHSPAATCSPSRYSVLTGNYPHRGRLSSGVWNSYQPSTMIIPGQTTLGDVFSEAGYRTGFVGKLHNGAAFWNAKGTGYTSYHNEIDFTRSFDRGPTQLGFDYSFLLPGGISSRLYAYFENDRLVRFDSATSTYRTFTNNENAHGSFVFIGEGWGQDLNGGRMGAAGWAMDNYDTRKTGSILARKALAFMDRAIGDNEASGTAKPFFLYIALPQPHVPYSPPDFFNVADTNDEVPTADGVQVAGHSGKTPRTDVIREIDLIVGEIVAFLEQHGELEKTLIVFSSDNSAIRIPPDDEFDPQGVVDGIPLRDSKGSLYEGGHRVPLLARWGDGSTGQSVIEPGTRSSELLGLQDLAATFYALLGRQRPAGQANDSKSFLPVLLDERSDDAPLRDHMIVQGSPKSADERNINRIDRAFYKRDAEGQLWKLSVISHNADPVAGLRWKELYNLSDDPGETNDLIDDPASQAWLEEMQYEYLYLIVQPQTVIGYL